MTENPEGRETIRPAVEALLFASGRPIPEKEIAALLETELSNVQLCLEEMATLNDDTGRGIRLEKAGGGWRIVTRPEYDSLLRKYFEVSERSRLSLAALETLSIIAYRQPVTAPEISEIRGVNSSAVIQTLFDRKLITTAGRKPIVGTPFLYKTTNEFLLRFGLNELAELPRPEEVAMDLAVPAGPDPEISTR